MSIRWLHPMSFARIVLLLAAIAYGIFGMTYYVAPAFMATRFDISLGSPSADNDLRAIYGGVGLGLALFFLMSASRPEWFRPALLVVVLTLAGTVSARVLSWFVAGSPATIAHVYHSLELIGLVLGIIALRRLSRGSTASA